MDQRDAAFPILAFLQDEPFLRMFVEHLRAATEDFDAAYLEREDIIGTENLIADNPMAPSAGQLKMVERGMAAVGGVRSLGENRYAVAFRVPVTFNVYYALWLGDYFRIGEATREM